LDVSQPELIIQMTTALAETTVRAIAIFFGMPESPFALMP
jgi:hypothetical protein